MVPSRTRIKICGLTRIQDVRDAIAAGTDAIGLVCFPDSKRYVTPLQAASLRQAVPVFVSTVCLFVNPQVDQVHQVLDLVHPDLLQFHGDESADFCRQFGLPYLKAFRVGAPGQDTPAGLAACCLQYSDASGWLFDSYSAGFGGSGQRLDADLLQQLPRREDDPVMVLSGGLRVETVADDILHWTPYAVDVSSGVETAPGIKDPARMRAFVRAVELAVPE
ncbi:phosphoribosylanthranilate isomerase [Castellaniella sp.]|uniref:phosphoribosylanthranilate isomerase n=1 Tax=Castellaniella sp. TaxID=1955812 RepID=UPI002AFFE685|nr:phosphoribosylanthranilate isomerase [Castellaniella sp.]